MHPPRINLILAAVALAVLLVGAFVLFHRSSAAATGDPLAYCFIA